MVAVALTLLVLQITVPHHVVPHNSASALANALGGNGSQFVSYVISFYVVAHFWLIHHRVFRQLAGHREGLAWWNFAFLITITLMPFTSALLGSYSENPLAVDIFALNLLLASLASQAVILYGSRRGLLRTGAGDRELVAGRARAVGALIVIVASGAVAWVSPDGAKYMWLLLAVVPRLSARWVRSRPGTPAADDGSGGAPRLGTPGG